MANFKRALKEVEKAVSEGVRQAVADSLYIVTLVDGPVAMDMGAIFGPKDSDLKALGEEFEKVRTNKRQALDEFFQWLYKNHGFQPCAYTSVCNPIN